jgi:hypothetical protein
MEAIIKGEDMKKLAAVLVLIAISTVAFALDNSSNGHAWNRASSKEKNAFAQGAVRQLGARYQASEMRACLDSFYAPPAPDQILSQQIAEIAALCHIQLK